MNGKGDTPRPKSISYEEWEKNWGLIFNQKKKETKEQKDDTQRSQKRT